MNRRAVIVAVVRILVGLFFVTSGLPKLTAHQTWVSSFHHWHVPLAGLAVSLVGSYEVIGGALLALGVAARLAAALFVLEMTGALLFAGLTDGGHDIYEPVALATVCALLALRGAGAWQLRPATLGRQHASAGHPTRSPGRGLPGNR
jgi:putative oxidoreductase